jgi:hypothetical protein
MQDYIPRGGLRIAPVLDDLLVSRIAPGTGVTPDQFWAALESLVAEFAPRLREALKQRDDFQASIDNWHHCHAGKKFDPAAYRALAERLEQIEAAAGTRGNLLFYLATPPSAYPGIIENLGAAGLARLNGKVFRIGHLGDLNEPMVLVTLTSVEIAPGMAGIPHQKGGVDAAIASLRATLKA